MKEREEFVHNENVSNGCCVAGLCWYWGYCGEQDHHGILVLCRQFECSAINALMVAAQTGSSGSPEDGHQT